MPKLIQEKPLLPLLHSFINEIKKGKHLQKNGKKLKPNSIRNYKRLDSLLNDFCKAKTFELRLKTNKLSAKEFKDEQKYWKKFYLAFTGYLYDNLGHHDNNVGRTIKLLRSVFNYLIVEKGMNIGFFHKKFYIPSEEVDFQVLSTERLHQLIYDKKTEQSLSETLKMVKDVFVFGCTVALRYSDLMALEKTCIENMNGSAYLKVRSIKTDTITRIKLPIYIIEILNKYKNKKRLLPYFDVFGLNKKLKILMRLYGFTEEVGKTRQKRGVVFIKYKSTKSKSVYRFCDLVCTHTMRRTAITNMLSLGMNENAVRKISGHAANSKEFYRYVSFAQTLMDSQIDMVYQKMTLNNSQFVQ